MIESGISPGQCRAARAYLDMTQEELATAAGVVGMTIQSFEREQRIPIKNNLAAIRNVFEGKGVVFLAVEDGFDGLLLPFDKSALTTDLTTE